MEENKPPVADSSVQENQDPLDAVHEEGEGNVQNQDVEAKEALSLDELNKLAGREGDNSFKSKADFNKHYDNMKGLVGDPEAHVKNELEGKVEEKEVDLSEKNATELAGLKKELATKDFILANEKAKDNIDVIEAYAEKNDMTLSEAWEKIADKFTSGDSKVIKTNNRINPVQNQKISDLAKNARTGHNKSQENLVAEMLGTESGKL